MHTASAKCPRPESLGSPSNAFKTDIWTSMDLTLGLLTVQEELILFKKLQSGPQMSMAPSGPKSIFREQAMLNGFGRTVCRSHSLWKQVRMFCRSGGTARTLHRCGTLAQILKSSEPNKETIYWKYNAWGGATSISLSRLQWIVSPWQLKILDS